MNDDVFNRNRSTSQFSGARSNSYDNDACTSHPERFMQYDTNEDLYGRRQRKSRKTPWTSAGRRKPHVSASTTTADDRQNTFSEEESEGDGVAGVSTNSRRKTVWQKLRRTKLFPRTTFERVATKSWFPQFSYSPLEKQYRRSTSWSRNRRFKYSAFLLLLFSFIWAMFLWIESPQHSFTDHFLISLFPILYSGFMAVLLACASTKCYQKAETTLSYVLAISLLLGGLLLHWYSESSLSLVAYFGIPTIVLTIVYSLIPLPLVTSWVLAIVYSVVHEIITGILHGPRTGNKSLLIFMRLPLYLIVHLSFMHMSYMREIFCRSTFWHTGQSLVKQVNIDFEHSLEEKILRCVMPSTVVNSFLDGHSGTCTNHASGTHAMPLPQFCSLRDCLSINRMDNVSILFASVVGFPEMSVNKTAMDQVNLLNDLFSRFDELIEIYHCEKVSTFADCYYCVSGCPEPYDAHANSCVDMGIAMMGATKKLYRERCENVSLQVGIHTGSVMCGVIGKQRYRFDIFSDDVRLANQMQIHGSPGCIHITEATFEKLKSKEQYVIKGNDGGQHNPAIEGIQTYMITGCRRVILQKTREVPSDPSIHFSLSRTRFLKKAKVKSKKSKDGGPTSSNQPRAHRCSRSLSLCSSVSTGDTLLPGLTGINRGMCQLFNSIPGKHMEHIICPIKESLADFGPDPSAGRGAIRRHLTMPTHSGLLMSHGGEPDEDGDIVLTPYMGVNGEHPLSCTSEEISSLTGCISIGYLKQMINLFDLKDFLGGDDYRYCTADSCKALTRSFREPSLEMLYQQQFGLQVSETDEHALDTPRFAFFAQILISYITFWLNSLIFFSLFPVVWAWLVMFGLCTVGYTLILILATVICYHRIFQFSSKMSKAVIACTSDRSVHTMGLVILLWPAAAIGANILGNCSQHFKLYDTQLFFFFVIQAALSHCLAFTPLRSMLKIFCSGFIVVLSVFVVVDGCDGLWYECQTLSEPKRHLAIRHGALLIRGNTTCQLFLPKRVASEFVMLLLMLLVLCIVINRAFELAIRLNFISKLRMQFQQLAITALQQEVDKLLKNVLPVYVCKHLKVSQQYAHDHKSAAVLFASLVNFEAFFSEAHNNTSGCFHVLNGLIGDFDNLLEKPQFKGKVEKIRTRGATYLAAAGLTRDLPGFRESHSSDLSGNQHVHILANFALEMHRVLEEFNQHTFGYEFALRIGLDCGPVIGGVIGSTNLIYDIWGDAVSMANHLESSCRENSIQISESVMSVLEGNFLIERRHDPVCIHGKGEMTTYFILGRSEHATDVPGALDVPERVVPMIRADTLTSRNDIQPESTADWTETEKNLQLEVANQTVASDNSSGSIKSNSRQKQDSPALVNSLRSVLRQLSSGSSSLNSLSGSYSSALVMTSPISPHEEDIYSHSLGFSTFYSSASPGEEEGCTEL